MKIKDFLDTLPEPERSRTLGRIEGMEMALRIIRNRAQDCSAIASSSLPMPGQAKDYWLSLENEDRVCEAIVRNTQVGIGSGTFPFGDLTPDEQDDIWRIY